MLKKMDKLLLLLTLILFAVGAIMIFSASNVAAYIRYSAETYTYLKRQMIIFAIGIVMFLFLIRIPTKKYGLFSWFAVIALFVMLGVLLVKGRITNGASSWFSIGLLKIQPSEYLKVVMIVWVASFYDSKRNNFDSIAKCLTPLVMGAIAALMIALQPDLGTAIIFMMIVFFMYVLSPVNKEIKKKSLIIMFGLAFIGLIILIGAGKSLINERQLQRFDFSEPCSEEKFYTDGNQVCNSYIAVNNGGLFGKGLGNSTQKYLYLPEAHTDFIFAIVLEELGLIIGIGILLVLFLVILRIIYIGRRSINNRGALMCYAIAFYIFMHMVINLMGIFGLMPMTGVPLPFLSYGGSFTLSLIGALTIVQRVAIESNKSKEKAN